MFARRRFVRLVHVAVPVWLELAESIQRSVSVRRSISGQERSSGAVERPTRVFVPPCSQWLLFGSFRVACLP